MLKPGGEFILQVPNKYFLVDLHTGLPFLYYLPLNVRCWLLTKLGYKGIGDVMNIQVLSRRELISIIRTEFTEVRNVKVIYPPRLIMPQLRPLYSALSLFGLFKLVPFGFLFVANKAKTNSESLNR